MHVKFGVLFMDGMLLPEYYKHGDNSKQGDYVR
jgi:hypothetical protein